MTDRLPPDADGIARAARTLADGGVVAFPTDTVYGVGVAASRRDRLPALFELKRRPIEKRIPILVDGLHRAVEMGFVTDIIAERLAEAFWPGALTVILPSTGGGETQAFRAPDHPVALALIAAAGPILATSANRSGEPDTLGADEVLIAFAVQQDELDAVVDGGAVAGGTASTILNLSVKPARILREGPVTREQLASLVDLEPRGPEVDAG